MELTTFINVMEQRQTGSSVQLSHKSENMRVDGYDDSWLTGHE